MHMVQNLKKAEFWRVKILPLGQPLALLLWLVPEDTASLHTHTHTHTHSLVLPCVTAHHTLVAWFLPAAATWG